MRTQFLRLLNARAVGKQLTSFVLLDRANWTAIEMECGISTIFHQKLITRRGGEKERERSWKKFPSPPPPPDYSSQPDVEQDSKVLLPKTLYFIIENKNQNYTWLSFYETKKWLTTFKRDERKEKKRKKPIPDTLLYDQPNNLSLTWFDV